MRADRTPGFQAADIDLELNYAINEVKRFANLLGLIVKNKEYELEK